MFYGSPEEQEQAALKVIEKHRTAAGLCVKCKPVIEQFDGKMYNIRLERAFHEREELTRVYSELCGKNIDIYCCIGHSYERIQLANLPQAEAFTGNKRINSAAIIGALNNCREEHLKRAYEAENALKQIDNTLRRMEELKQQVNKLRDSIPYEIRDIYDLNLYVRR